MFTRIRPTNIFRTLLLALLLGISAWQTQSSANSLQPQTPPRTFSVDIERLLASGPPPSIPPQSPQQSLLMADPVAPNEALRVLESQQHASSATAACDLSGLPATETEITPRLQALSRALENDPKLIFDYVHNHINYVPIFGLINGANGAYWAERGGDWDQTALFIALMRAAGYDANFNVGTVEYDTERLANWLGVKNNENLVKQALAYGGIPVEEGSEPGRLKVLRVWTQAVIAGKTYYFDPAMKEYEDIEGMDLAAATGYDHADFLAHAMAGAEMSSDRVRNINEANIRDDLALYSMNLVHAIRNNQPEATVDDVIGGRRLLPEELSSLPTSLPYARSVTDVHTYSQTPAAFLHMLRVQHQGIDCTFSTFQISDKRLSIGYDGNDNNRAGLLVEGEPVAIGDASPIFHYYQLTLTIDHPYAANHGSYGDAEWSSYLMSGGIYAIAHDFGESSDRLIALRREKLAAAKAAGWNDNAEPVLGEGLWLIGLIRFDQLAHSLHFLGQEGGVIPVYHHRIGIVGQNLGYYMDMGMTTLSFNKIKSDADISSVWKASMMISSALEHGVFEQLQGSHREAVSTIKVLQLNNQAGERTFLADKNNWNTIRPLLHDYNDTKLDYFTNVINQGSQLLLPENGNTRLNDWGGIGYIHINTNDAGDVKGIGMMLWGRYWGGMGSFIGPLVSDDLLSKSKDAGESPDTEKEVSTPPSKEPVDMATGAYFYTRTDLSIGGEEPFGLHLQRSYNSRFTWAHNYEIGLHPATQPGPALGQRAATDAASMITWAYVALDLAKTFPAIDTTMSSVLVAKWGMDQLIDNAFILQEGLEITLFIRMADGSWNPPPGIVAHLVKKDTNLLLQYPQGAVEVFNAQGKIIRRWDRNGNIITFSYNNDGYLKNVDNGMGCSFTFVYNNDGLLTSVSDMRGRTISYTYNNGLLTAYRDASGHVWRYEYDASHQLRALYAPQNPAQPLITNEYDTFGRVITQTTGLGDVTTFRYGDYRTLEEDPDGSHIVFLLDKQGHYTGREDASGHRIVVAFDGLGRMRTITDRLNRTIKIDYHNASGQISSLTNARGEKIRYQYTAQTQRIEGQTFTFYNLTRIDCTDDSSEQFVYDDKGNFIQGIDKLGKIWRYAYNHRGQLQSLTNPEGGVIAYTYKNDGNMASRTDSDTGITTYTYDSFKRLQKIIHPDGTFMQFAYDPNDQIISLKDENNHTYTFEYDANGNLRKTIDPNGKASRYAYDLLNRWIGFTNRLGKTTTRAYDSMDRLTRITDPNHIQFHYGYNARGWLEQIAIAGKMWKFDYDDEGRIVARTSPSGNVMHYQTNEQGYLTRLTDPLDESVALERDSMNGVTKITDALQRTVQYSYDVRGLPTGVTMPLIGTAGYHENDLAQITSINDFNNKVWRFDYSTMGRLRSCTDPLGNQWKHTYDSRGRFKQTTYPDGATLVRTYDGVGQTVRLRYSNGPDLRFTYDANNNMIATDHLTLVRDAEGRIIRSRNHNSDFGASYDDGGRLKTVTYNNGAFTVRYSYDPDTGVLSRVEDSLTGAWITFIYDKDDRLIGVKRSNSVNATYSWDQADRLIRIREGNIIDIRYTLDAAGEVKRKTLQTPLNPADYLVSHQDAFNYDDASRIQSSQYRYDRRGRLIASPDHKYRWDGASRLIGIDEQTLSYDGVGNLIRKNNGIRDISYEHNYAMNLSPVVAEKNQKNGRFLRYYVWKPDGSLLYMIDASDNKAYFFHFDQIGSTLALTDMHGNITDAYAYTPFGKLLHHEGAHEQPFTYVGAFGVIRVKDIYNMRFRYYDPDTARFLSKDREWMMNTDALSINPYVYAYDNPLLFIDPLGMQGGKIVALGKLMGGLMKEGVRKVFGKVFPKVADSVVGKTIGKIKPNKAQVVQSVSGRSKLMDFLLNFIPGGAAIRKHSMSEFLPQVLWDVFAAATVANVTLPAAATQHMLEYGEPNTHGIWSYSKIYDMYYNRYGYTWGAWYTVNANVIASYGRDAITTACSAIVSAADWAQNAFVHGTGAILNAMFSNAQSDSLKGYTPGYIGPYSTKPPGDYTDPYGQTGYTVTPSHQVLYH